MKLIKSAIVGVKFNPGAHDRLLETTPGSPVELRRDPANKHDANAIECRIGGLLCGFIPGPQAAGLARDMDVGIAVRAISRGFAKIEIEVDAPGEEESAA